MELYCINTLEGLRPMYPTDYDEKRKLKLGAAYKVQVSIPRNIRFHNKYFRLLDVAWEFLSEGQQAFFHESRESFRQTIQIAAGSYDMVYSPVRKEWIEQSKSISFAAMDESEFEKLYNRVLDIIIHMFLDGERKEEFSNIISTF